MAAVSWLRNALNAGEISPKLEDRPEAQNGRIARAGSRRLENMIPWPHGGGIKRPGTKYVAAAKIAAKKAILIPFRFSVTQAYVIEAGDLYMRFYMDGGRILNAGNPYEIATTYTEAQLAELQWTQSNDVLFLAHPAHPVRKLTRTGHTAWTLVDAVFDPPVTYEAGHTFNVAVTLAATSGQAVAASTPSDVFLAGDLDRVISWAGGFATITAVTDARNITLNITSPFQATTLPQNAWTLLYSPTAGCTPGKKAPVGAEVQLTLDASGWRAADLGKWVQVNSGFVEITTVDSATQVHGIIRAELDATGKAGGGTWKLRSKAWDATRGYPAAMGFHQARLWLGGQPADPAVYWASATDDFFKFAIGTKDADAIEGRLVGNDVHAIRWFDSRERNLFVGTDGGTWSVASGTNDPTITPTAISQALIANSGSPAGSRGRTVQGMTFYPHRHRKRALGVRYQFDADAYQEQDVTQVADHITEPGGLQAFAWQDQPFKALWWVRGDGVLACLVHDAQNDLLAWSRHITDGAVEAVAVIPYAGFDQLWLLVKRTVGGADVRFVETLTTYTSDPIASVNVDCALQYSGASTKTISGMTHLAGRTVEVCADGVRHRPAVVSGGGSVTLDYAVTSATIGLGYRALIETMDPDFGARDGTSRGRKKRIFRVAVDVLASTPPKIGEDEAQLFGIAGAPSPRRFDQPSRVVTGELQGAFPGSFGADLRCVIVHDDPLPFELRSVAIRYKVSE